MSPSATRKAGIILRNGGAVVAIVSIAVIFALEAYFSICPTIPYPERGLIAGHNIHGTIHYVPPHLQLAFDWAFNIAFYTVVPIAVGIFLLREPNRQ